MQTRLSVLVLAYRCVVHGKPDSLQLTADALHVSSSVYGHDGAATQSTIGD